VVEGPAAGSAPSQPGRKANRAAGPHISAVGRLTSRSPTRALGTGHSSQRSLVPQQQR
jgi:hypothetical protein